MEPLWTRFRLIFSALRGGNLLRERIVASASNRFVIVADESKLVEKVGRFPLPVEVTPMALPLEHFRLECLHLMTHFPKTDLNEAQRSV